MAPVDAFVAVGEGFEVVVWIFDGADFVFFVDEVSERYQRDGMVKREGNERTLAF